MEQVISCQGSSEENTLTLKSLPTQPTRGYVNTLPSRLPLMPPLFVALLPTCIAIFLQTSVTRSFKFSSTVFKHKFPSTNGYPRLARHFFFSSSVFSSFLGALMPALLFPLSQSWDLSITQFTDAGIFPPLSLAANISSSLILLLSPLLSSTSAKIRAIEAKLQMMEENPDDDYSGPSAYVYNKPPERKRWEPYSKSHHNNQSRPFRKFRRWPILPEWGALTLLLPPHLENPPTHKQTLL